jgi:methanogenic corrinoid protein MtbC1
MSDKLVTALTDMDESLLLKLVQERLDSGSPPQSILDSCQRGMTLVGKRFESGEFYISDLIMAGELFKQVNVLLAPHFKTNGGAIKGKVVVGTVKGDIHDIGKNLVVTMLRAGGYEVLDLGVDVPVDKFVEAIKSSGAKVLGLSGLVTTSFDSMKETITAMNDAGLRSKVKIMVGGGSLTEKVREYVEADALGKDAQAAVVQCDQWI